MELYKETIDETESQLGEEDIEVEQKYIDEKSRAGLSGEQAYELDNLGKSVKSREESIVSDLMSESRNDDLDGTRVSTKSNEATYKENKKLSIAVEEADVAQKGILEADRHGRLISRNKFWSWIVPMGVSALLASGLIVVTILNIIFDRKTDPKSDPLLHALTDEERALIKASVERWQTQPDQTFWSTMADYVKQWTPSLQAQLLFMTYTKLLVPPVNWPAKSADWVLARVEELVAVADGARTLSEMYRKVATLTYAPDPTAPDTMVALPRYLAAELCNLALAQIIKFIRTPG